VAGSEITSDPLGGQIDPELTSIADQLSTCPFATIEVQDEGIRVVVVSLHTFDFMHDLAPADNDLAF